MSGRCYVRDTHVMLRVSNRISHVQVGLDRSGAVLFRTSHHTEIPIADVTRRIPSLRVPCSFRDSKSDIYISAKLPSLLNGYESLEGHN